MRVVSHTGGQGFLKCSCTGSCTTKRCKCYKNANASAIPGVTKETPGARIAPGDWIDQCAEPLLVMPRISILTFRQLARTSTGPDTLFDASERPWANTAHNIAFDVDSFRATVHACIVRSFAAWSRRYAARMQRCTSELDLAMLPISYRLAVCAKRARQSRQTRRQRRLPLRSPRTLATC